MFDFLKSKHSRQPSAEMAARAAENRLRAEKRTKHAGGIHRRPDETGAHPTRDDAPYFINEPSFLKQAESAPIPSDLRIEGVRVIQRGQYRNCEQITSVFIGPEVEVIGEGAFEGCKNLRNVEFSEGLKVIGKAAFAGCTQLEDFTLPSTLVSLSVPTEQGEERRTIRLPGFMQGRCSGYEYKDV